MIPNVIYELASALSEEFNLDFDDAVGRAWSVFRTLEANGIIVADAPPSDAIARATGDPA